MTETEIAELKIQLKAAERVAFDAKIARNLWYDSKATPQFDSAMRILNHSLVDYEKVKE